MFLAYTILAILRAAQIGYSSVAKLRHAPRVVKIIVEGANVPMQWLPWLAACEIAGAAGILIGIAWAPLGIIAALGLVLYFVGAIIAHLRAGDFRGCSLQLCLCCSRWLSWLHVSWRHELDRLRMDGHSVVCYYRCLPLFPGSNCWPGAAWSAQCGPYTSTSQRV